MAGSTTAARMSLGAVASSEDMNPVMDWSAFVSRTAGGYENISNIPQTHRNLRIWLHNSQQSNWYGWGYVNFNTGSGSGSTPQNTSGPNQYLAYGWSQGTSSGYVTNHNVSSSTTLYDACGYSNLGHIQCIDIYNYASSTIQKPYISQSQSGVGNQTSYAASSYATGHLLAGTPITQMNMYTNYGSGSTSYNRIMLFGWGGTL